MAPEMNGNEYNFQSDIYSLGLVIWEVVQLIPFKGRKKLFNELVVDEKTELVVSFAPSISSSIISMTKRKLEERMKSIVESKDYQVSTFAFELERLTKEIKSKIGPLTYVAKNGKEFQDLLSKCSPGDIINLTEGEFEGPFKINCSDLKIIGQGSKTVLNCDTEDKTTIKICGNNNCVSNININYRYCGAKLVGSDNSILNVGLIKDCDIRPPETALKIYGSRNKISGLKISQSDFLLGQNSWPLLSYCGIESQGDYNALENIEISNVYTGISLSDSNNTVTNVLFNNTITGMFILGSQNNISTINYIKDKPVMGSDKCCGVEVHNSENHFENIQCTGMGIGDLGFEIFYSSMCKISNSSCGPLKINGSEHTLINVDCVPCIQLRGEGHTLIKCKGQQLLTENAYFQTFVLEDNNFDEVKGFQNDSQPFRNKHLLNLLSHGRSFNRRALIHKCLDSKDASKDAKKEM
jgi:hypothetical protein